MSKKMWKVTSSATMLKLHFLGEEEDISLSQFPAWWKGCERNGDFSHMSRDSLGLSCNRINFWTLIIVGWSPDMKDDIKGSLEVVTRSVDCHRHRAKPAGNRKHQLLNPNQQNHHQQCNHNRQHQPCSMYYQGREMSEEINSGMGWQSDAGETPKLTPSDFMGITINWSLSSSWKCNFFKFLSNQSKAILEFLDDWVWDSTKL